MGEFLKLGKQKWGMLPFLLFLGVYFSIPDEDGRIRLLNPRWSDGKKFYGVLIFWLYMLGIFVVGIALRLGWNPADDGLVEDAEED